MRTLILAEISSHFNEQVDERQLFNHIKDMGTHYELSAYGETLKFDKESGGLISDE